MPAQETLLIVIAAALGLAVLLLLVILWRQRAPQALLNRLDALKGDGERLERVLREEQRGGRGELAQAFEQFRGHVQQQLDSAGAQQRERIDGFGTRLQQLTERTDRGLETLRNGLIEDARKAREEAQTGQQRFGELLQQRLNELTEQNEKRMGEMRGTLEAQIKALQQDNAQQLDKMRQTVDEKLQSTLETRLGQSFKLVSERLEAVQRGLGEMQSLAAGVGDLKRVLTNVKTRGTFGEVQLGMLLEQVLVAEQYAANVATVPASNERVEFAIRMPGQEADKPVWLPIDAKFPREDYERLLDAQENADADAANAAALALERRVRDEAKTIREKYIAPPHTTDFAILFLPTEGLYAEVIRRPGLFEQLQREHRVTVAGPTTLNALLNSLQMGFRTLAIEQRSSEVWELLGAVKNEFGKFGGILDSAIKQVDTVRNTLKRATGKTTTITRKLRGVESLSGEDTQRLLGASLDAPESDTDDG
ncbi:DNA recombination protein RmuC [Oleiagrimonas citrea]|uniref:DNA recombination protein RmuC n=1 Tax=Oleiagrimonas citrea TaxID=1665687 RepID=A0A846ZQY3_9GAMM|nr:DNA recombination protein RmuC [Oleiagrimonas citrea]NKZ39938.1 DNA recombination protein RmuC [Oleiagrimonas citrea]